MLGSRLGWKYARKTLFGPGSRLGQRFFSLDHNPLLHPLKGWAPQFDKITAEHVKPAVSHLLDKLHRDLDQLETDVSRTDRPLHWSGVMDAYEHLSDQFDRCWGVVSHLKLVKDEPQLRQAMADVQSDVVRFQMRLGQSAPLYRAFTTLQSQPDLTPQQQRVLQVMRRDAELSGVGLAGDAKNTFNKLQEELTESGRQFSQNVLDSNKQLVYTHTEPHQVAGLPRWLLEKGAADAAAQHPGATAEKGPWKFLLDAPTYIALMTHSEARDLREQYHRAFNRRAADAPYDNTGLIGEILSRRHQMATLLGFPHYAALSVARKMAGEVKEVDRVLEELRSVALPHARYDQADLRKTATALGHTGALRDWDSGYYIEKLRQSRFEFSQEELREYLPFPRVLEGLFALAKQVFGVNIVSADGEVPVWHPDVRYFRVSDAVSGQPLASFYLDPYSRPSEKRGGAWMAECVNRSVRGDGIRLPVAYMVCNQNPPQRGQPALMTLDEVETLFHEFGHAAQHMFTTVSGLCAGLRGIEWDAIELPSQFMENFLYDYSTIRNISCHVRTGEPIPQPLFQKIRAAKSFRAASSMLRQLHFAITDMTLHSTPIQPNSPIDAFEIERQVAKRTHVRAPSPDQKFLCAFQHIFAASYAAGYYSYKWAEILSADAYRPFEEAAIQFEDNEPAKQAEWARLGRQFRDTVLSLGGSVHPREVFIRFRGRAPSTLSLLKASGLRL
eukprot:TRINITY_DN3284_c0_g1_i1.p1 TRINITY_DN3284_c0_g1~~TRINITY_DN3284_c0_g1_i1.p1  ORF type:complete len:727 (-),score=136.06 TRINITY_DN3284_c0_g1_i1:25-2205(-)